MSIDTSYPRPAPTAAPPPALPGVADRLLAPVDRLHDSLAGGLAHLGQAAESELTKTSPVLGACAQFGVGAAGAFGAMAEGTWQMLRHPVRTLSGLWALATHVPLTPMWLWRLVRQGPSATLAEDKAFLGMVARGFLEPYAKDWRAGRYFAVAGRAAVDIGTLYVGIKQAKSALDQWRARRAAMTPEESLASQVLGSETRASGQVLGEGTALHDGKLGAAVDHPWGQRSAARGQDMLDHVHRRGRQLDALMPESVPTREVLERAAARFPGDKAKVRAQLVRQLERDQEFFRKLRRVGPERLMEDGFVNRRYRLLTESVDARMDAEIFDVLGVRPHGVPKEPLRAAEKLQRAQAARGANVRLGNLEDLARGRIDLPSFDTARLRGMLKQLRQHFGEDNLIVKDYLQGKPFYRGRLHVKIRDGSGLWYELQMGPKQLSTFYDTPFQAAGRTVNVHDAVYKGLLQLDEGATKLLGRGSVARGEARVAAVLDEYVDEVNRVVEVARAGKSYVFGAHGERLQKAISQLVADLPADKLPIGLR